METSLPDTYLIEMQKILEDSAEMDAFLQSYSKPRAYGLRFNPLKAEAGKCLLTALKQPENASQAFMEAQPDSSAQAFLAHPLSPVPWTAGGYYYDPEDRPGRHPLHEAGAYYIQEPSAMSVATLLDPRPGEAVCDLCAAPGGKSTQIAGMMQGRGLLVSNEIIPSRAKTLSQNIERMGIPNALVCNEPPERLAAHFPMFFHRILVDAPCSGEGMFRKDENAVHEWSPENVRLCAKRQRQILEYADAMLQPGGILVYSTCTFSVEENEENILWFLRSHPDYILTDWHDTALGEMVSDTEDCAGLSNGILPDLAGAVRLWPHKLRGEGHFAIRLQKKGTYIIAPEELLSSRQEVSPSRKSAKKKKKENYGPISLSEGLQVFHNFTDDYLTGSPEELSAVPHAARYELFGSSLYQIPAFAPDLAGIKTLRAGLHLGTLKKNRFEPSHALARYLQPCQVKQAVPCTLEASVRYLKGETLHCDTALKGWTLVCCESFPLGWGKAQNGVLKNHFPKGLRRV